MSMQMDADGFKKEQIGTLFVRVGAFCPGGSTRRGVWGVGGPSGGSTPKCGHALQNKNKHPPA